MIELADVEPVGILAWSDAKKASKFKGLWVPTHRRKPLLIKVQRVIGMSECWEWQGWRDAKGYGRYTALIGYKPAENWQVTHGRQKYQIRKGYMAHAAVFLMTGHHIPPGYPLDHWCENHPCCRPSHLEPVTHQENQRRHHYGYDHVIGNGLGNIIEAPDPDQMELNFG